MKTPKMFFTHSSNEKIDTIRFAIPYKIPLNKTLLESEARIKKLEETPHKTLVLPVDAPQLRNNQSDLLLCLQARVTNTYGIHDDAGHPFYGTVLSRGSWKNNDTTFPRGKPKNINQSNNNSFYESGFFINYLQFYNFGHLLTETVSSIHPLLLWKQHNSLNSNIPIFINEPQSSDKRQVQALLELLEIPRQQVITIGNDSDGVKVGRLFVASPTHVNRNFVSKCHSRWAKKYFYFSEKRRKLTPKQIITSKKVYISTDHGRLLVVDIKNGKTISILKIDNEKISRPFVLNQSLFIIKDNSIIKLD